MSIQALFDHKVRIWRASVAKDAYSDDVATWAALGSAPTANNARPDQAWAGTLQDRGAGEEEARARIWYLDAMLDAERRDVIQVVGGPEAGKQYRILALTRPTAPLAVHHLEANTEEWEGSLA